MDIPQVVKAPFENGASMGQLAIARDGTEVFSAPLLTLAAVEEAGFFKRVWHSITLMFSQLFGWDLLSV